MAFLSRHLTKTELKWGHLEQMVALVSWGLRKARRYTSLCPEVVVRVGDEAEVACIADSAAHLRLRALLVDLSLYKVKWEAGPNHWQLGEEVAARQKLAEDDKIAPPVMEHADIIVKRAVAKGYTLEDMTAAAGHTIVQFDGGAASKVGTGGSLLWGAQGHLLAAWAWRFGAHISTNNAAELAALKEAVE